MTEIQAADLLLVVQDAYLALRYGLIALWLLLGLVALLCYQGGRKGGK